MWSLYVMTVTFGFHFRPVSNIKFITGSEVEESKRENVALRFNDGQFINFVIFSWALKSSMNFNNLPVQGKSQVFNPLYSSRQGAKEYVR